MTDQHVGWSRIVGRRGELLQAAGGIVATELMHLDVVDPVVCALDLHLHPRDRGDVARFARAGLDVDEAQPRDSGPSRLCVNLDHCFWSPCLFSREASCLSLGGGLPFPPEPSTSRTRSPLPSCLLGRPSLTWNRSVQVNVETAAVQLSHGAVRDRVVGKGIVSDLAAVRAALTEPWSNGQTEGQITKLKLVKRQMYGRARLDLLRARIIVPA